MPQSNLIKLTYYAPKANIRLTTYADTIVTEPMTASIHQLFNDSGTGGGCAKPPAFRVRVGVPVPGVFHYRKQSCFAVGLSNMSPIR